MANDHSRPKQYCGIATVSAIRQNRSPGRFERPPPREFHRTCLLLKQRAPGGEIRAHTEHAKTVRAGSSRSASRCAGAASVRPHRAPDKQEAPDHTSAAVGLLSKAVTIFSIQVRRRKAVVVGERNNRTDRARDGLVVRPRQPGCVHSLITDPTSRSPIRRTIVSVRHSCSDR